MMFNKTFVDSRTINPSEIKHNHKNAPSDHAIREGMELVRAARKEAIRNLGVTLLDTPVDVVLTVSDIENAAFFTVKINGRTITSRIDRMDIKMLRKQEDVPGLVSSKVASVIADYLICDAGPQNCGDFFMVGPA
jgi:hypothetical protein